MLLTGFLYEGNSVLVSTSGYLYSPFNDCKHISVYEGDASLLENKSYDIIIANINRNILLKDMATYVSCLNKGGVLFLSGFYFIKNFFHVCFYL